MVLSQFRPAEKLMAARETYDAASAASVAQTLPYFELSLLILSVLATGLCIGYLINKRCFI